VTLPPDDPREGTWAAFLGCATLIVLAVALAGWAVWERMHPSVTIGVQP
jgi:hypothetical protein